MINIYTEFGHIEIIAIISAETLHTTYLQNIMFQMTSKSNIKNIAIIGLGLIGGSLAKALKGKGFSVTGITKNPKTIKLALKEKVISRGFTKLSLKALENIDIVFICTPLPLIKDYLNKISKLKLNNKFIITDAGSTKSEICKYAKKVFSPKHSILKTQYSMLNTQYFFIGGHPMAGTEKSGFTASEKDLFKNRAWILTPTKKDNVTLNKLNTIIKKVGGIPIITTPEEHDQAVALISHLPLLTSIGLCQITKKSKFNKLASMIASSGFRDTTRIAGGNPEMNSNLLLSNSIELQKLLPLYLKELNNLLKMAKTKSTNLYKELNIVGNWRSRLYNSKGKNNLLKTW